MFKQMGTQAFKNARAAAGGAALFGLILFRFGAESALCAQKWIPEPGSFQGKIEIAATLAQKYPEAFDRLTLNVFSVLDGMRALQPEFENTFHDLAIGRVYRKQIKAGDRIFEFEEVPPLFSLFRDEFDKGGNAGAHERYFALLNDVRVFTFQTIGSNELEYQHGTASVVNGELVSGGVIPYLLTLRGSLDARAVHSLLRVLSDYYHSSELLLPNLKMNPFAVREEVHRSALEFPAATEVRLNPPLGWSRMARKLGAMKETAVNPVGYSFARIIKARDVPGPIHTVRIPVPAMTWVPPRPLASLPLISRVRIANMKMKQANQDEILAALSVRREELIAYVKFMTARLGRAVNGRDFEILRDRLKFDLKDLLRMPADGAAESLARIHHDTPQVASREEWHELAGKIEDSLKTSNLDVHHLLAAQAKLEGVGGYDPRYLLVHPDKNDLSYCDADLITYTHRIWRIGTGDDVKKLVDDMPELLKHSLAGGSKGPQSLAGRLGRGGPEAKSFWLVLARLIDSVDADHSYKFEPVLDLLGQVREWDSEVHQAIRRASRWSDQMVQARCERILSRTKSLEFRVFD